MSYYDTPSWQSPGRQAASWELPPPPSRSGASSAMQREEPSAFGTQIEEVDRALDNLINSGKLFNPSSRRDSMPMMGGQRPYADYEPRMGGTPSRHHSTSEFDPMRPHSASNLQNFYANQRYQPRPSEAEQMMQAKRRMAAQRERELRNYHQEQQYNRSILAEISTQSKSERAISPSAMNEEERRELIARQHRALYGNEAPAYYGSDNESQTPRPIGQSSGGPTIGSATGRGPSPLAFDAFGMHQNQMQGGSSEGAGQYSGNEQGQHLNATTGPSPKPTQQRSRANSTSSPSSNNQSFSLFESAAQQSSRTSTSSPGGSPPRQAKTSNGAVGTGVAPIGTRPAQSQAANPALNKGSTTPLPSPLSYGFAPNENANANSTSNANERSTSAASNPQSGAKDTGMSMAWGSSSGVWGKNPLGVQASVWG